ncbi:MAG: basic amino acid ABC transporter substrate-binding protein [Peptococcaceae bacterium]|nr:basic amino acid ABC transporter substrate-binding protein [Peptococcaceae bacterium]
MLKVMKLALLGLLAIGILGLAGCGSTTTTKTAQAQNVLRVGSEIDYAPFEYVDGTTNQNTGFDLDLIRAVGKAAGFDSVQIENIAWDGLIPALNDGKVDAVISAMTIIPSRQKGALFSDRYFQSTQYIAVKAGSPIKSAADLINKRVGVQTNTTGQYACEKLGVKNILKFDQTPDAFNALKIGQVDAVVVDSPVVMWFIKQNPSANVTEIQGNFPKEYYGIPMKLGNTALAAKINAGLKQVIADGTYNQIYKKYFNEDAPKF